MALASEGDRSSIQRLPDLERAFDLHGVIAVALSFSILAVAYGKYGPVFQAVRTLSPDQSTALVVGRV